MPTLALSTGEAELGATARGVAESDGVVSILQDFGIRCKVKLESDASAAIGITQREGLGKIRHLDISLLWIQQKIKDGDLVDLGFVLGTSANRN